MKPLSDGISLAAMQQFTRQIRNSYLFLLTLTCVILTGCFISPANCAAASPSPASVPLAKIPVTIYYGVFRGKIIRLSLPKPGYYQLHIQIEHVYYDPQHQLPTGVLNTTCMNDFFHGLAPQPALKVGQEAIWIFDVNHNPPWPFMLRLLDKYFSPPCRQGVNTEYPLVLALAEELEKLGKLPPDARVPVLLDETHNSNWRIAEWAANTLYETAIDGSTYPALSQTLESGISDSSFCLAAQVRADEDLAWLNTLGWRNSSERLPVFRRWVKQRLDSDTASQLSGDFQDTYINGDLTKDEYLTLLVALTNNPSIPADTKDDIQDNAINRVDILNTFPKH